MRLDAAAAFLVGLVLVFVLGRILFVPLKLIFRLLLNAVVGGALLWIANLAGGSFGLNVPINPITALVAGFLGIPGVVLIVALQYFFTHPG